MQNHPNSAGGGKGTASISSSNINQEVILNIVESSFAFLSGTIQLPNSNIAERYESLVVIVDDDSGSMSGSRQRYCSLKSQLIIKTCIEHAVPYCYAT